MPGMSVADRFFLVSQLTESDDSFTQLLHRAGPVAGWDTDKFPPERVHAAHAELTRLNRSILSGWQSQEEFAKQLEPWSRLDCTVPVPLYRSDGKGGRECRMSGHDCAVLAAFVVVFFLAGDPVPEVFQDHLRAAFGDVTPTD